MASVVDLCNIALAHLGDEALVSSIDPPEGSTQADHCARFYPVARDMLLASYPWGFATVQRGLTRLAEVSPNWRYTYVQPADLLRLITITEDETEVERFERALDTAGQQVIHCDAERPVAKYTRLITDTSLFSPLFSQALTWQLASLLAGPVMTGSSGAQQAQRCAALAQEFVERAKAFDAAQMRRSTPFEPSWLKARRGDGDYSKF